MTAVVVHFSIYYGRLTPYMQAPIRNPGVAFALAIISSVVVGLTLLYAFKPKEEKMVMQEEVGV